MSSIQSVKIDGKTFPSPGLGLMSIGNLYQKVDREESKQLLRDALKEGVTFWDTADVYGCGLSEEIIGEVLKETGARDQVFLASKFGIEWEREGKTMTGKGRGDPAYVRQCVEESIKRLGSVPDLYYQHRQDQTGTEVEETWRTLIELQKEGKLKALGVSEVSPDTLKRIINVARISALQIEYSPFERDIETNGLVDICRENNIAIVAYSPIGRGLLSGKFKSFKDFEGDRRANFPRFSEENFEKNLELVPKIEEIAKRKGVTAAQLCIAWVSAQGDNIIPIPGTGKSANMKENFAARDIKFTEEDLKELRSIIDAHETRGKRYPDGMLKMLDKGMEGKH